MLSIGVMQQHVSEKFEPNIWNVADLEDALQQAGLAYFGELENTETLVSSHAERVFALLSPPKPGEPPPPWAGTPRLFENTLTLATTPRLRRMQVTQPLLALQPKNEEHATLQQIELPRRAPPAPAAKSSSEQPMAAAAPSAPTALPSVPRACDDRTSPLRSARARARWPVVFCGLLACTMSLVAFLRSPLATVPAVRPYAMAVEHGLVRGYVAFETATHHVVAATKDLHR